MLQHVLRRPQADPRFQLLSQYGTIRTMPNCSMQTVQDSSGSPVHVLTLSIQAVRSLPRLRAPGIVPCIDTWNAVVWRQCWSL